MILSMKEVRAEIPAETKNETPNDVAALRAIVAVSKVKVLTVAIARDLP